jgi:Ca2+-binding RTX toxin-like protein
VILRGVVGDLTKATTLTLGANLEQLDASQTGLMKLNLTGNTLSNTLIGNDADNLLSGLAGNDTLNGNDGNDTLDGGLGQDTVNGGAGNDQVTMLVTAGNVDTIDAGADTDTLSLSGAVGGNGLVVVDLSAGDQVVSIAGDPNRDIQVQTGFENVNGALLGSAMTVTGSTGDNVIVGSNGNDTITGGAGNDTLIGGLGRDNLQGGIGNDVILLNSVAEFAPGETIDGGDGTDTLRYTGATAGTLTLTNLVTNIEGVEIANIAGLTTGLAAINVNAAAVGNALTMTGNNGANVLTGTLDDDTLVGNGGNDTLNGDWGNDTLNGGLGNDTFRFALGDGQDIVQDSSGETDRVLFQSGINPLDLIITKQANDLRIAIEGTTDQITVQNWYTGTANRTETIQAGNGEVLLSTQVETLIQAMAQFTTDTGLSWDAAAGGAGDPTQQAQFQGIIAANWQ